MAPPPLSFLAKEVTALGANVEFLFGARSAEHVLFEERLEQLPNTKLHIATDDGSKGHKGFVTDLLPDLLAQGDKQNTLVVTCGPELMEKKFWTPATPRAWNAK